MSDTQRWLTEAEKVELAGLNAAVMAAIAARTAWLDDKMNECSRLHVGDDIYDIDSGTRLGRVVELYRYWRDRDEGIRDKSVETHYRYETSPNCFGNTSRQYRSFGTREDAIERAERRADLLRANLT